jgi:peptidyl-tRNA hydrolase ICT1
LPLFIFIIRIDFSYARSSGPGGQNVNKLNTKAVIRFHVMSAEWIPLEARTRLAAYQATRVSKEGELIISAQDHRTQSKNKDACIQKLKEMIAEALITPKEREMWIGLSEKTKKERIEYKKRRSEIKQNRQRGRSGDDDY